MKEYLREEFKDKFLKEENKSRVESFLSPKDEKRIIEEIENNNFSRIPKISPENQKRIISRFIGSEEIKIILKNFKEFNCFDKEAALMLIDASFFEHSEYSREDISNDFEGAQFVAENINLFPGSDQKEIAAKLIDSGKGWALVKNFEKFDCLSHEEFVSRLIDAKDGHLVVRYFTKFDGVNPEEIARRLIASKQGESVADNLEKFRGIDYEEIAQTLIATNQGYCVANNLEKFSGLDYEEIAHRLIATRQGYCVASRIKKFVGVNQKEIVTALINSDGGDLVAHYLDEFGGIDHKELALELINSGKAHVVADHLRKFNGLDQEIAFKLVDSGAPIIEHLEKFNGLDHNEIAHRIINAHRIISESHGIKIIAGSLGHFHNLSKEIAVLLASGEEGKYANLVDSHPEAFVLSPEINSVLRQYHLKISEIAYFDDNTLSGNARDAFRQLSENVPAWQDNENILKPFEEGAELFGYEKMFQYLDRKGMSRHDGLHNFHRIVELARSSNLPPQVFYNNILEQVGRDDATYEDGTAHHHLNNLASNLSLDFESAKIKLDKYKDIEKLKELFEMLDEPQKIFSSWKNLKKYEEAVKLLDRVDILEKLQELKVTGNLPLYHYIETLAFHPNIEMEKVFQFWQNPQYFLELDDSHTPTEVHNRKKPSNYIEFPNLDLSAVELRDALVEGKYDSLQVFRPLSIEYSVEGKNTSSMPLCEKLTRALGKRSEGIVGEAKNPTRLFKEVQNILEAEKMTVKDYLSGGLEISETANLKIKELIYNQDIGLPMRENDIEEYRAKINLKSDPDGVVAGNDTACCMPFGSGKNNVYTFNPDCSLLIIQKKNSNGIWRTIAQSVLTKDVAIGKNVQEVVGQMQSGGAHLNNIISEDILKNKESVIACDNIEVAPNFRGNDEIISSIYRDFFAEYIKRFGQEDGFSGLQVVIGQGYTDALTNLPEVDNEFIPRAPVGYSDKLGKLVYSLDLQKKESFLSRVAEVAFYREPEKSDIRLPKGVSPLTFQDSLPVAYIEGKAYKDNENLIEYLHNMENALIAKDVNNSAKSRPNLSFKYQDERETMHGYILAYEGRIDKEGEPVVYVSDLASDGSARAGGSLILGFSEAYKHYYLDENKLMPIYAQMREKTSYAIITKQLEKLSQNAGINFEIEELDSYEEGVDVMHRVLIKPVRE